MAYWWVNHKQTRDQEIGGDYLWSPKANANGARNQTYDNMARARQGDVVFSYAGGVLGAVGVVRAGASTAPKPIEFGRTGSYWANEGWFLPVEFSKATSSVRPKDHLGLIAPLLPPRHSPVQPNGNGNQGVYLTGISDALGQLLVALTGMADRLPAMEAPADILSWQVMDDIAQIKAEAAIPETQRLQLIQARIGQGIFRAQVLLKHPVCRVTQVADKRLLRASHIKPWRQSDNHERLDGANGIMLSPHVDALFDLGLVSFEDTGELLIRGDLSLEVLRLWSIPQHHDGPPFPADQHRYLQLHRSQMESIGCARY